MQNEIFENINTAGKASYEAMQELGAINTKALQKLTELQFSLTTLGIESGVEQMKLLTNTKDYKDLLAAESDFASDYSSKVMDITRQTADVLTESRQEMNDWIEKSIATVSSATTSVVPASKPAAKRSTKKAA